MALEWCSTKAMEYIIKDNGNKMSLMESDLWPIPMEIFMKDNGRKGYLMEKESMLIHKIIGDMTAIGKMVNKMDTEKRPLMMALNFVVILRKVSEMEKGNIKILKVTLLMANLLMENLKALGIW